MAAEAICRASSEGVDEKNSDWFALAASRQTDCHQLVHSFIFLLGGVERKSDVFKTNSHTRTPTIQPGARPGLERDHTGLHQWYLMENCADERPFLKSTLPALCHLDDISPFVQLFADPTQLDAFFFFF